MFSIYMKIAALLALVAALTAGYFAIEHRGVVKGRAEIQGKWNIANAAQAKAEQEAIAQRNADNAQLKLKQEQDNDRIKQVHRSELAQVRADIARAPRLRVGNGLCPRPATATQTTGTSRGDGADTGGGLVSESVQRAIDDLELRVEEGFATGRACQAFIHANHLAP